MGPPRLEPIQPDDWNNAYGFARAVTFRHGTGLTSTGRIDLYKRGCFVLEAKQGSDANPPKSPFHNGGLDSAPQSIHRQGRGKKLPWPKSLPKQVQAVRAALARAFQRARTDKVAELLATLATLGHVREVEPGTYGC